MDQEAIRGLIRSIPDFPKKGILFRDITPVLGDKGAFRSAVESLADVCPPGTEMIAGIESRGFIFAAAVAQALGAGFVPVRKAGKLPYRTESVTYDLEYGTDTLEVHQDAFEKRKKTVLIDDLLATGGTAAGTCRLLEKVGAEILKVEFLIELADLKGRAKLAGRETFSLIVY